MEMDEFIKLVKDGEPIRGEDKEIYTLLLKCSDEALRITAELNGEYHSVNDVRDLFSKLIGKKVDKSFNCFPPFYTDFGKNITIGKNVFINTGCSFQDRGGIYIGDGTQIGQNVVMATLNHGFAIEDRNTTYPSKITIGKNVWIGSNATILPGVTIGDNAVIGAASVVTHDVPKNTVVVGSPARIIKKIE